MKRVISSVLMFALVMPFSLLPASVSASVTIFSDGFESSPNHFANWTAVNNDWDDNNDDHSGFKSAEVRDAGSDELRKNISTEDKENLVLSYWYKIPSGLGSTDHLKVQWSVDGTNWNTIINYSNSSTVANWTFASHNLPDGAEDNTGFRFRFLAESLETNDKFRLDDVSLSGDEIPPPPVDVCPNIEGLQETLPEGMVIEEGDCVTPEPEIVDVCPNLEGVQETLPEGYEMSESDCVEIAEETPTDVCPNIEGNQATLPEGYEISEGNCIEIVEEVVVDVCPNLDGNQENIPDGYVSVDGQCIVPPAPMLTAILNATKIVCDSENFLPNWGEGGADIDSTTASSFLLANPNCHAQKDWSFQWSLDGVGNPGDNVTTDPIVGWNTFGLTDTNGSVSTEIPANEKVWVREVFQNGFVPFTGVNTDQDVSAEIYCSTDVYNYDNWDLIDPVLPGVTYYCVAFNAPIIPVEEPTDVCSNIEGVQETLPEGMVSNEGQCVLDESEEETPTDVCPNIEGNQATLPEGKVLSDGNCVDAQTNPPATPTNNGGGNGPIVGSFFGANGPVFTSPSVGQVLGASCSVYLNSYLRYGRNNDSEEVKKLQTFLNEYLKINLAVSGIFDLPTFEAVKQFQIKENEEVIGPWAKLGLLKNGEATGYVFKTTKRRINMIKCAELNLPIPNLIGN